MKLAKVKVRFSGKRHGVFFLVLFFTIAGRAGNYVKPDNVETASHESTIHNELSLETIQIFHNRGPQGTCALYLYDNKRFVEKHVEAITSKKYTRKGTYKYNSRTGEVRLVYDYKKKNQYFSSKRTLYNPSLTGEGYNQSVNLIKLRDLKKNEKPKYHRPIGR